MSDPKFFSASATWAADEIDEMTDTVRSVTPSDYAEEIRYLPASVTPFPGPFDYSINPFMREIVDCFDVNSPVREVSLMKGVQVTYTVTLENGILYVVGQVKNAPAMLVTADAELAQLRLETYILPMLNLSGLGGKIQSSDEDNPRKTGKTKKQISWEGGGFLLPYGANNANKMRQSSIRFMLKDELDGWPQVVGRDGDPDKLTDDRCAAYWEQRKIFRGSTPLTAPSKIYMQYKRGDQRKYMVRCISCGFPQELIWQEVNKETGQAYGMHWETDGGILVPESVRYLCKNCGHPHQEHDKKKLFAEEEGAHWKPTAKPVEPGIRSYHLPAMYSPVGMQPWSKSVVSWLEAWDTEANKVKDVGKLQVFYNNVLGIPFEVMGSKIRFTAVSAHRRAVYRLGQVPNLYAARYSGSKILFLLCLVDVHKSNLAVSVIGFTRDAQCYVVNYWRFERAKDSEDCTELGHPVWGQLREVIEEKRYTADDGTEYRIALTFIDAGYANDTVTSFCSEYVGGVYAILGRDRPAKSQSIKEFAEFKTQAGAVGYRITVDHYKDRLAPVLRREWSEDAGLQRPYHFNAPVDITDKQLKELTKETRREKRNDKGEVHYEWHRPGNAPNELWDLLVYAHAGVEIFAHTITIKEFELETIDWPQFWDFVERNPDRFGRIDPAP